MQEPSESSNTSLFNHPVLARGFRPFFLLGALYSMASLLIWGCFYAGHLVPPSGSIDPISWHAHEMIYGFAIAIVTGFLLTAVANWTGGTTAHQKHLAGLCILWLAGRIVMNIDLGLPLYALIAIEGAFIPALAITLGIPLLRSRNKRNFVFLILLSILFTCDITFFLTEERTPLYIAIMVIITMISLIGGRIIPAFTVAALRRRGEEAFQTPQNKLDMLALASLFSIIIALAFLGTESIPLAVLAFTSTAIHLLRLRRYQTLRILNDPMVWILHVGYLWVIAGLLFISLSALGILPFSVAIHALTAGAIGSMTLGMMCRVTLGHTGRNLITNRPTIMAFILMQLATLMRVFGVLAFPAYTNEWIIGSAALWSLCFALYVFVYAPILWRARPDGRPA